MASQLKPVDEAIADILASLGDISEELVTITQATGRILSQDVIAGTNHPLSDMSAMDGFAVRACDTEDGAPLAVIGESAAGHPFRGEVSAGQAVRIYTGAYLPQGADAILLQEDATIKENQLIYKEGVSAGRFIRRRGQDFARDDVILEAGTSLTARSIALAALALQTRASVWRKPKIAILSSGDELVPMGALPRFGQLINSNSVFLAEILQKWGAEVTDLGILPDEKGALLNALQDKDPFDLIITTGGASVGAHDHIVSDLTEAEDASLDFWKIAMRPGKPLILGRIGQTPLVGLPGNPVSVAICTLVFLRPILAKLTKRTDLELQMADAICETDLAENDQRQDYLRGEAFQQDGQWHIRPYQKQDSAMLGRMARANAVLVRPPFDAKIATGQKVKILLLPPYF